jgi:hypothetical protein
VWHRKAGRAEREATGECSSRTSCVLRQVSAEAPPAFHLQVGAGGVRHYSTSRHLAHLLPMRVEQQYMCITCITCRASASNMQGHLLATSPEGRGSKATRLLALQLLTARVQLVPACWPRRRSTKHACLHMHACASIAYACMHKHCMLGRPAAPNSLPCQTAGWASSLWAGQHRPQAYATNTPAAGVLVQSSRQPDCLMQHPP